MQINHTEIEGLIMYEPKIFSDERGFFFEAFNKQRFIDLGLDPDLEFVQLNHSKSAKGILRGLHFQIGEFAQDKLVRVTKGSVVDVVVDIRKNSKTFGHHTIVELTEENKRLFFVPKGFAHGFLVLSDDGAEFEYLVTNYYSKEHDRGLIWNDPEVNIKWSNMTPILSEKDQNQPSLEELKKRGELF